MLEMLTCTTPHCGSAWHNILTKKRLARINYGAQKQTKAESEADITSDKNPENKNRFRGMNPHRPSGPASPSSIQTILSALELHQVMREALVGFTAEKVNYVIDWILTQL